MPEGTRLRQKRIEILALSLSASHPRVRRQRTCAKRAPRAEWGRFAQKLRVD